MNSSPLYPAFVAQSGFLGTGMGQDCAHALLSSLNSDKAFTVVGLPYDGATTNRPGARFGPSAIRAASLMLCDAIHPHFGLSPRERLIDCGDIPLPATSRAECAQAIEQTLSPFLAGGITNRPRLIAMGGDHSITLSLLRLHAQAHKQPIALVHFDAHCDTWADHFGEPSGHGTWVHEAVEEGLIDVTKTVQIGLRSSGEAQTINYIAERGGLIQTARQLRGLDGVALLPRIHEINERLGQSPVYVTLDIDCLDPSFAPGTGTPEPAGLTSAQLFTYLEELRLNWVGFDCVEVSPVYDHAQITALTAAQAMSTWMSASLHYAPSPR